MANGTQPNTQSKRKGHQTIAQICQGNTRALDRLIRNLEKNGGS